MRVSDNLRSTQSQDGGIVLDILHGQIFRLNFVGSRILELLKQDLTESEITDQLAKDFALDRSVAESDVREFLAVLQKHHLLSVRNDDRLA